MPNKLEEKGLETPSSENQGWEVNFLADLDIHVYWQDCREFAKELRKRWEAFNRGI